MCSVLRCRKPQWPGGSLQKYEGRPQIAGGVPNGGDTCPAHLLSPPIGLAYLHPLGHKLNKGLTPFLHHL